MRWVNELRSAGDWYDEALLRLSGGDEEDGMCSGAKANATETFRCLFAAIQTHDNYGPEYIHLAFDEDAEEQEARRMLGVVMHAITKMHGKQQVEFLKDAARSQIGLGDAPPVKRPYQYGGGGISLVCASFWPDTKPIPFGELKRKTIRRTFFDGLDQNRRGVFVLQDKDESMGMFIRVEQIFCIEDRPVALVQYVCNTVEEVHAPGSLAQLTGQTLINYNREEHSGMFPIEGLTPDQVFNSAAILCVSHIFVQILAMERELDCNGASLTHEYQLQIRKQLHAKCERPMSASLSCVKVAYMSTTHLPLCTCAGCWSRGGKFATMTCSRCKVARYCCAEHQKVDWHQHSKACRILKRRLAPDDSWGLTIGGATAVAGADGGAADGAAAGDTDGTVTGTIVADTAAQQQQDHEQAGFAESRSLDHTTHTTTAMASALRHKQTAEPPVPPPTNQNASKLWKQLQTPSTATSRDDMTKLQMLQEVFGPGAQQDPVTKEVVLENGERMDECWVPTTQESTANMKQMGQSAGRDPFEEAHSDSGGGLIVLHVS
jgi:hypothetical protein